MASPVASVYMGTSAHNCLKIFFFLKVNKKHASELLCIFLPVVLPAMPSPAPKTRHWWGWERREREREGWWGREAALLSSTTGLYLG